MGKGKDDKDNNEDPSPTHMPTHTRPKGNFQDKVTQQGVFPSLPSLCVTPHTSFFFFASVWDGSPSLCGSHHDCPSLGYTFFLRLTSLYKGVRESCPLEKGNHAGQW